MRRPRWPVVLACSVAFSVLAASALGDALPQKAEATTPTYAYATNGVLDNIQGALGSKWKLLLTEANLGGTELEVAEVTLPAGTTVPGHTHGSVEVIYVLSGTYGHEVNGKLFLLKPGSLGIVRPGDKVRHLVPQDGEAKLLILWAPAGEAARLRQSKGVMPDPVPEAPAPGQ
jgi:quercetin dioxygenase-like cupin family protein